MEISLEDLNLLSQLVIAGCMTGIIWLVQLVVYPQFLNTGESGFGKYHRHHLSGMGGIVAPLMIGELALSLFSLWQFRGSSIEGIMIAAAVITIFLWITTFAIHVPLHQSLKSGWSAPHIEKLVSTNWIRTWLWTFRLGLLFWANLI